MIHPKKSLSPEKFHKENDQKSPKNFELTPNGISEKRTLDPSNKNRKSILIKKDNKIIDYLKNDSNCYQQIKKEMSKTRKQCANYQINRTEFDRGDDSIPNMDTCDGECDEKGENMIPLWLNADFADKETEETYFESNSNTVKHHRGPLVNNRNLLADSQTSPKLSQDSYSPQTHSNFTIIKEKGKVHNQINSFELVQKKLFRQQKDKNDNRILEDDQLSDSDQNSLKLKLVKMKINKRSNSTNNEIFKYKPDCGVSTTHQVIKNKVNMHISVARKNEAIKKIINNLNTELNPSDKGIIDLAVKLDIRKCSLKESSPVKKLDPMIINIQNQNCIVKERTISDEQCDTDTK